VLARRRTPESMRYCKSATTGDRYRDTPRDTAAADIVDTWVGVVAARSTDLEPRVGGRLRMGNGEWLYSITASSHVKPLVVCRVRVLHERESAWPQAEAPRLTVGSLKRGNQRATLFLGGVVCGILLLARMYFKG
jgi:hypothetical protein